jgi:hypothetical protein
MRNDELMKARELFAELGVDVSSACISRWCTNGVMGRRLKAKRIGSSWYSTRRWVNEFCEPGVPAAPTSTLAAAV